MEKENNYNCSLDIHLPQSRRSCVSLGPSYEPQFCGKAFRLGWNSFMRLQSSNLMSLYLVFRQLFLAYFHLHYELMISWKVPSRTTLPNDSVDQSLLITYF